MWRHSFRGEDHSSLSHRTTHLSRVQIYLPLVLSLYLSVGSSSASSSPDKDDNHNNINRTMPTERLSVCRLIIMTHLKAIPSSNYLIPSPLLCFIKSIFDSATNYLPVDFIRPVYFRDLGSTATRGDLCRNHILQFGINPPQNIVWTSKNTGSDAISTPSNHYLREHKSHIKIVFLLVAALVATDWLGDSDSLITMRCGIIYDRAFAISSSALKYSVE